MMSMAELSAWTMFMYATASALLRHGLSLLVQVLPFRRAVLRLDCTQSAQLFALPRQVGRHVLVDVLKHCGRIETRTLREGAVLHRLFPTRGDMSLQLLLQRNVAILRPFAERNEVLLQTNDGITQRPRLPFVLRTVTRRVITR